eukprot:TRINITY_DN68878_c0_g1_i1.p1 TRINITY_DN68878_c0_g1~~TRINITY_DN68878_c0_g1_i1.p1  ORF type:complete len:106 (+),score=16.47 TRINITY_DN68878_c0_g1_i1:44-319(+)
MASKLFKDVKASVCEIIEDYKKKHAEKTATPEETKASSTHPPTQVTENQVVKESEIPTKKPKVTPKPKKKEPSQLDDMGKPNKDNSKIDSD